MRNAEMLLHARRAWISASVLWSCCRLLRIACQGSSSFRVKHSSAFRIPHSAFPIQRLALVFHSNTHASARQASLDQCVLLWSCCRLLRIACQGSSSFRVKHSSAFRIPHSAFPIQRLAPVFHSNTHASARQASLDQCVLLWSCCRLLRIACQGSSSFRVKHFSAFRIPHSLPIQRLAPRLPLEYACFCTPGEPGSVRLFSSCCRLLHRVESLQLKGASVVIGNRECGNRECGMRNAERSEPGSVRLALVLLSSSPHRVSGIIQLPR